MSRKASNEGRMFIMAATAGACIAVCAAGVWWFLCGPPPQLGGDEQVFEAVDALFTAVRARDGRLLGNCEQQLRNYQRDGKLAAPAVGYLDDVINLAREGKWRPAAEKLYTFMKAQRRTQSPPVTERS